MTVYVEYVLIDNMAINTLLLYATFLSQKQPLRFWRVLLSAFFGTVCALFMPLLKLPSPLTFLLKFAVALLMILIVLPKFKLKSYIMSNLIFLAYTFVLGGAILGLFYLTGTDFVAMSTLNYAAKVPVGLYIAGVALFCYLVFNVVRFIGSAKKRAAFVRKVRLVLGGTEFNLSGYVDSGNLLSEDGLPVCFVFDRGIRRQVSRMIAESLGDGKSKRVDSRFKVIFYDTVAGKRQRAYAFKPDICEVDNRRVEIYAAVAGKSFSGTKPQFDILLNSAFAD